MTLTSYYVITPRYLSRQMTCQLLLPETNIIECLAIQANVKRWPFTREVTAILCTYCASFEIIQVQKEILIHLCLFTYSVKSEIRHFNTHPPQFLPSQELKLIMQRLTQLLRQTVNCSQMLVHLA